MFFQSELYLLCSIVRGRGRKVLPTHPCYYKGPSPRPLQLGTGQYVQIYKYFEKYIYDILIYLLASYVFNLVISI